MDKRNRMRRMLALLVVLVIIFGLVSPPAYAADDDTGNSESEGYVDSDTSFAGTYYFSINPLMRSTMIFNKFEWAINANNFWCMYWQPTLGLLLRGWSGGFTTNAAYFMSYEGYVAYCIQGSIQAPESGATYSPIAWEDIDANSSDNYFYGDVTKRDGVARALTWGAPNNGHTEEDWIKATAMLVLDVVTGYRDENLAARGDGLGGGTAPEVYKWDQSYLGHTPAPYFYEKLTDTQKGYYDQIIADYQNSISHSAIPSFSYENESDAIDNKIKLVFNAATGNYEATLTDTNGVLADYNYAGSTSIPGLTITVNGNNLQISANATAAAAIGAGGITLSADGLYYKISDSTTILFQHAPNTQVVSMLAGGSNPPVTSYLGIYAEATVNMGSVQVYKYDEDTNAALSGAYFELTHTATNQIYSIGPTDTTGYAALRNIPFGTYKIKETIAPTGYELSPTVDTFELKDTHTVDNPYTVNKPNSIKHGYVQIIKKDSQTGKVLSGAVFTAINEARNLEVTIGPTNAQGIAISDPLPFGTYLITEVTAPPEYKINAEQFPISFTIDEDCMDRNDLDPVQVTVLNDPDFGYIEVFKYDTQTNAGVNGATFVAKHTATGQTFNIGPTASKNINGTMVDGYAMSSRVPLGNYEIVEVIAPAGYELNTAKSTFTVTKEHTEQAPYVHRCGNNPYGYIEVYKWDSKTNKPLDGAYFVATNVDTGLEYPIGPTATGIVDGQSRQGYAKSGELPLGTYELVETVAPAGFVKSDEEQTITLTGAHTKPSPYRVDWINDPEAGLKIIKKMVAGGSVEGWKFRVQRKLDGVYLEGDDNGYFTTNAAGEILIKDTDLLPGYYIVEEIIPDDSPYYCTSDNPQTVLLVYGEIAEVVFENDLYAGQIRIQKLAQDDSTPLPGAVFGLEWSEDGVNWSPVVPSGNSDVVKGSCNSPGLTAKGTLGTDSNGWAIFTNLHPFLMYRITEVSSPVYLGEQMTLLLEPVYTERLDTYDSYSYVAKVMNTAVFELPRTGADGISNYTSAGLAIVATAICGLAAILSIRRRAADSVDK